MELLAKDPERARIRAELDRAVAELRSLLHSRPADRGVPSLAGASAEVRVRSEGSVEVMEVSMQGMPPRSGFNLFVTQVPNAPFGLAWYQGDLQTNDQGRAHQMFVGRFSEESFIVAPGSVPAPQLHHNAFPDAQLNPSSGPVHTFHVGVWFDSPADAVRAGCPGDVTPFSGEHAAGIQLLSSRNFIDAQGPLVNLKR